jgi:hypothetical protein
MPVDRPAATEFAAERSAGTEGSVAVRSGRMLSARLGRSWSARTGRTLPARLALLALLVACGPGLGSAQAAGKVAATFPMGILLPDSELVYGPSLTGWDVEAFLAEQGGYLSRYNEIVDGEVLTGAQIVQRVAEDYSLGPRLLLTLVEMQSRWVSDPAPAETRFPVGGLMPGLQPGLAAAADGLNGYYYARRFGGRQDIEDVGPLPEVNAATFALLAWLGRDAGDAWAGLEAPSRFYGAWMRLFEDPLAYDVRATTPPALAPSRPRLPFGDGELWYFVAGPHSPWGAGGPRAAIDLAPPPAQFKACEASPFWVRASAPGRVLRSRASGVVVDLDGDGYETTGWLHVYAHLSDRVAEGTRVAAGDILGHPSCDGGLPSQSRVSFSRRLHGEWMPADAEARPLILGGWAALPGTQPGEGWLVQEGLPPRQASLDKVDAQNGVASLGEGR